MAASSKEARLAQSFQRAHITIDSRTRQLEYERRRLREVEEAIAVCEKNLSTRQKKSASENATGRVARIGRETVKKEPKSDQGRARLEENLVRNLNILHREESDLITQINNTRQERSQVDAAFRSLKTEIKAQKREFLRQSEVLQSAHLEATEILAQAKAVSTRVKTQRSRLRDIVQGVQTDYQRQDMLLKSMDLKDSMDNNMLLRASDPSDKNFKITGQHGGSPGSPGGRKTALQQYTGIHEKTSVNQKQLCRRVFQLAFFNAIQRRRIRKYQKSREIFEQATETIHLSTGIDSLEEIVSIFSQMEDRSFSLMTYVSSAYSDIEQVG